MRKYVFIGSILLLAGCTLGQPEDPDNPEVLSDVCPVNGPFEATYDSDTRYCDCPEGYIKQSDVVGYEICYDDAECPIMEVECVTAAEYFE